MRKTFIFIFSLLLCGLQTAFARHATNVRAMQDGNDIVITYDLDEKSYVSINAILGDEKMQESYWNNGVMSYRTVTKVVNLRNVEGDIGSVKKGKNKRAVWHVLQQYGEEFVHSNVSFEVVVRDVYDYDIKTFLLAEYGYGFAPQHSWGVFLGQTYIGLLGWYLSGRTNFSWAKDWQWTKGNGSICDAGGYIGEELPFYSGKTKTNHFMVSIGLMTEPFWTMLNDCSAIAIYLGATYGQRYQLWQTADGQWITYGPTAYKGFGGEVGIIADIRGFSLMVGVSTIEFKYMEINAGIGWTIPRKYK